MDAPLIATPARSATSAENQAVIATRGMEKARGRVKVVRAPVSPATNLVLRSFKPLLC